MEKNQRSDLNYVNNKTCPYCISTQKSLKWTRADGIEVYVCKKCGLGYVQKYPLDQKSLYGDGYYEDSSDGIGYDDYQLIDSSYFVWSAALVSYFKKGKSVFDLGATNGIFLDLLKSIGFSKLDGSEFNDYYAAKAREKGYSVDSIDFISNENLELGTYDVVTAWSVLEHIPNIRLSLEKISSILRDDGVLFLEVPCMVGDKDRDDIWLRSSLEHVYYFEENSLKSMIRDIFGNECFGMTVNQNGYGSTFIGFVSKSKEMTEDLSKKFKILKDIKTDSLNKLEYENILNLLIFHSRYTKDYRSIEILSKYILENNVTNLQYSFIGYISLQFTRYYKDVYELLKAKEYFLERIEYLQNQVNQNKPLMKDLYDQKPLQSKPRKLLKKQIKENESLNIILVDKQKIIDQYASNKFVRLYNCLKFDNFGFRKFAKIIYLVLAIITPEFIRRKFRPIVKNTRSSIVSLKNKIVRLINTRYIVNKKWPEDRPLVSVIIPCFNYGQYVEEAIDSVLSQTFQNFEIIVVDGGSIDEFTVNKLKSLNKPKTKIYFREGQHLVGDNRNYGINLASGKYICCLDADDKIKATYLEKALFLLETKNYDIVSCSFKSFGNQSEEYKIIQTVNLEQELKSNWISTVAVFRKEYWEKVGGFYDYGIKEKHVPEDWDFWIKCLAYGARVRNIYESLMEYRVHGTSLSTHRSNPSRDKQRKEIINNNLNLINSESQAISVRRQYINYKVEDALLNLSGNLYSNNLSTILFVLPYTVIGGADLRFRNIIKYVSSNNKNISVVTTLSYDPQKFKDTTDEYEKLTKEIYHLPQFLENEDEYENFVMFYLETRDVETIFLGGSEYFYKLIVKIKKKYPAVRIIDIQFNTSGHFRNNRKYSKYIDINVAENQEVKNKMLLEYGESNEKIVMIPSGVDVNELNKKRFTIKPSIIPDNKIIVSYIGRWSEEKGPDIFLKIANAMRNNKDYIFLLCGIGPEEERLLDYIKTNKLNNVINAGLVNSPEIMAYSDVLVMPSRLDGRPYALLEAFSMSLPVVASNVGGIPDIVKHGVNGLLCKNENINDFVEKIISLENNALKEIISRNEREYAENNFDIALERTKYRDLFKVD